jgi:hypothetical protein
MWTSESPWCKVVSDEEMIGAALEAAADLPEGAAAAAGAYTRSHLNSI